MAERRKRSRRLKKQIYGVFGYKCAICERKLPFGFGEFDHIKPLGKGGFDGSYNIQLLCQTCNAIKSDKKTNEEVMQIIQDQGVKEEWWERDLNDLERESVEKSGHCFNCDKNLGLWGGIEVRRINMRISIFFCRSCFKEYKTKHE